MSTRFNTEACDLCGAPLEPCYTPVASLRQARVVCCTGCGLLQSVYGEDNDPRSPSLSCDADWGNVRHGKGARLPAARRVLQRHLEGVHQVLDVGANRGDFVLWVRDRLPGAFIHAVEPDPRVTDAYRERGDIQLSPARFEDASLEAGRYDLVYCSHTLEHAASASGMLRGIHTAMAPGGLLFLEVPCVDALGDSDIVEEFFIDKHTFHFDRPLLVDFVTQCGFEILEGAQDTDPYNITLLARRGEIGGEFSPTLNRYLVNLDLIRGYARRLQDNRARLERVVRDVLEPLAARQRVGYWGAGRIFDALVKYGGLSPEGVHVLVDRYLSGLVPETHGIPIHPPRRIPVAEPQVVIILARSSTAQIHQELERMGVRWTIGFGELLAQCP